MVDNSLSNAINTASVTNTAGLGVTPEDQTYIDAQRAAMQQPTEIGAQANSSLFPGANQNINVGTQGGSVIGSNPIFVPTGDVYGFNLDLAQKQKDEQATIARNQLEASRGKFERRVPTELNDKRFQRNILDQSNNFASEFTNKAHDMYGEDAKFVLENPQQFDIGKEYMQKMDALDLLVSEGNQITTTISDMQSALDDGSKIYSDETLKLLNEYQSLMGDFQDGNPNALVGLRDKISQLEGGKAIDEYLHDSGVLSSIKPQILGGTSVSDGKDIPGYATLSTSDKKIYDKNIENLVDGWVGPNGEFRNEFAKGLITKESMTKRLKGYLQNQSKRKSTIKDTSKGGGGNRISDLQGVQGAPNTKTFNGADGTEYEFNTTDEIKLNTSGKRVSTSGLQAVGAGGRLEPISGVNDVKIVSLNNMSTIDLKEGTTGDWLSPGQKSTPVAIVEYEIEEEVEVKKDGRMVKDMVKKTIQRPVLYDETLAKSIDTDAKNLKVEKGYGTAALEKLKGSESEEDRAARLIDKYNQ